MFKDQQLLDLGCGTGEYTSYYAYLGANITGVDFNPISLERMQVFALNQLEGKIEELIEASVADWSPKLRHYDICVSCGVLHHLNETLKKVLINFAVH